MSKIRALILAALTAGLPLMAQQHPNVERGFHADKVYQIGDVDSVNLYNGNLTLQIPIGGPFSTNGTLRYQFVLQYNSKAWDQEMSDWWDYNLCPTNPVLPKDPRCDTPWIRTMPSRTSNAGMGWSLSLGKLIDPSDPYYDQGLASRPPYWMYEAPDGSQHSFPSTSGTEVFTLDGSLLRLAVGTHEVHFPDGTVQAFELVPGAQHIYRLKQTRDPFGNHLDVAYGYVNQIYTWTFSEYSAADAINPVRQHYIRFLDMTSVRSLNVAPYYDLQISEIDLAAFGAHRAVYKLQYKDGAGAAADGIYYGCHGEIGPPGQSPPFNDPNAYQVPRLHHVLLPDGAQWTATYISTGCSEIKQLAFPTGATVDWTFGDYTTPTAACPERLHELNKPDHAEQFYATQDGVTAKTLVVNGQSYDWTYSPQANLMASFSGCNQPIQLEQELTVTVTSKADHRKTVHYFSVWPGRATWWDHFSSNSFFDFSESGLPFTRNSNSGCAHTPTAEEWCLSSMEYECPNDVCNANPSRIQYVRYQGESESSGSRYSTNGLEGFGYRREVAEQTKFCEDISETDCHVNHSITTERSGYDGLGHFRTVKTSGSWTTDQRTEFTNFNPGKTAVTVDPLTWWNTSPNWPTSTLPWLNLFDASSVTTTHDATTSTVKSEFCFDDTTAFLNRKRTLKNPAAEGSTDLLSVFDHKDANGNVDPNGNITKERYFGGDNHPLGPNFVTCTDSLDGLVSDSTVNHSYSSGALASTEYPGLLKTLDLTIDTNTGLPSASRDPAGLETTYQYDLQGRVTTETPPGQAWTEYVYKPTDNPPSVSIGQRPNGSGTTATPIAEQRLYFDGLGRLKESRTRMPDSASGNAQWTVTQTTHDAFGRTTTTSMPEYRTSGAYEPSFTASHSQATQYDAFGRVIKATTPDSKDTTITYTGVKSLSRTQSVNGVASTTMEMYDGLGRLIAVDEPSLSGTQSNTLTKYVYEAGGHLTEVDMDDHVPADFQTRTFQYDGRGFLTAETQPELGRSGKGAITYEGYDARGHVGRKLVGPLETGRTASDFDLAYSYDGAERLTAVAQITDRSLSPPQTRPLKQFHFATDDGNLTPVNHRTGKLDSAVRYNYPSSLPNQVITPPTGAFVVAENFFYQNSAGLLSSHDVKIEHDSQSPPLMQQTTQKYTYNDLGQVSQLTYPDCPISCLSGSPITSSAPLAAVYSYGRLTSITGYGSLTYFSSGMVSAVTHGQNAGAAVTDTIVPDDSGMPRPKSITFAGWDDCMRPAPSINSAAEACPSSTSNAASVTPVTGGSYQWTITNGTITSGATSASVQFTAGPSGSVTLGVSVTNSCGTGTDTRAVLAGPTAQITSSNTTIKAGASAIIQVQLTGTPNWSVTLNPGNIIQSGVASSPVTLTVTPSATTTYSISAVSDASCTGSVVGGSVTVTVLPSPSGFTTSKPFNNKNSKMVVLHWNAVPSATSYRVERATQIGNWAVINPSCQQTNGVVTCTDDFSTLSVPTPVAYVYRVEAMANGVTSDPSTMDYATVADQLFTDEPLIGNSTPIRGRHVSELRTAVDAVRYAEQATKVVAELSAANGCGSRRSFLRSRLRE
jgi:YD repeat-containing protein